MFYNLKVYIYIKYYINSIPFIILYIYNDTYNMIYKKY